MALDICPVWLAWTLRNPLRRWLQPPAKLLGPYIGAGMTVLEPGCATGFFSLDAARLVGERGRVVCVDLQAGMIRRLVKHARRAGLADRIEARVCAADTLGIEDLAGSVDFAWVVAMVHELPDAAPLFAQLHAALKPGGKLLFVEPKGHVSRDAFRHSLALAVAAGFRVVASDIPRRKAVFEK